MMWRAYSGPMGDGCAGEDAIGKVRDFAREAGARGDLIERDRFVVTVRRRPNARVHARVDAEHTAA